MDFEYENLPDLCTHCNLMGHSLENCKRLKETNVKRPPVSNPKPRQIFVQKAKAPEVVPLEATSRNNEDQVLENEINEPLEAQNVSQKQIDDIQILEEKSDAEDMLSSEGSEFVEDTQQNFDHESKENSSSKHTEVKTSLHSGFDQIEE